MAWRSVWVSSFYGKASSEGTWHAELLRPGFWGSRDRALLLLGKELLDARLRVSTGNGCVKWLRKDPRLGVPRTSNFRSGARSRERVAVWSQILELSEKGEVLLPGGSPRMGNRE